MGIKSIPTAYRGVTYRSRTEARWAVFFTAESIPFRYEAEGFDMGGMRYLPDFWLPEGRCWFEVKPFAPRPGEMEKAKRLAAGTGRMVFIAPGAPAPEISIYAVSPTGRTQEDWRFAYAHEQGVGYLCDNVWNYNFKVRIGNVTADPGMYDMGPAAELERAGAHHFEWGDNGEDGASGSTIRVPKPRSIQLPKQRTITGGWR